MADSAPGTVADDLERLVAGDRRPHRGLDIGGVTYLQDVHVNPAPRTSLSDDAAASPSSELPSSRMRAGHKGVPCSQAHHHTSIRIEAFIA
jgi:hypothetical protein